jgi:hypothetical protein
VTRAGYLWAASATLVAIALGWQALHELDMRECMKDPRLILCIGPLDAWVLPLTLVAAVLLIGAGVMRLTNLRKRGRYTPPDE